jgi:hypothetical protein
LLIKEQLDLIDKILQANRTATDLHRARKLGQNNQDGYSLENGLLKKQERLIVAKSTCIFLIIASYYSLTTAYPGKSKTKKLIKEQYY